MLSTEKVLFFRCIWSNIFAKSTSLHLNYKKCSCCCDINQWKRREEIKNLIGTACFVAKKNLPFKYKKLCSLQQLNEIELGKNYLEIKDWKGFFVRDCIQSQAKSTNNRQTDFDRSCFIAIMSDGSTDKGK